MTYFDEELLETKWQIEKQAHTTVETGIYAGDDLITFENIDIPCTSVSMYLPTSFMVMPEKMKEIKYPSRNGPEFIVCNWNATVSFAFKQLEMKVGRGGTKELALQSQQILKNVNPSIRIRGQGALDTECGHEVYWFEYHGYQIDGQSYNQVYLIKLDQHLLYGTFSCLKEDKPDWGKIAKILFCSVEETVKGVE